MAKGTYMLLDSNLHQVGQLVRRILSKIATDPVSPQDLPGLSGYFATLDGSEAPLSPAQRIKVHDLPPGTCQLGNVDSDSDKRILTEVPQ